MKYFCVPEFQPQAGSLVGQEWGEKENELCVRKKVTVMQT